MARALNAGFKAATKAENIIYGYAIEFDFPFGFERLNSTPYTIQIQGNNFVGAGDLMGIPTIKESNNISDAGVTVALSGIDNARMQNIMNADIQYRQMVMWELVFHPDHTLSDSHQIGLWRMDTALASVGKKTQINIKASSIWDAWATKKERFYTDGDQQARYPDDTFFKLLVPNLDKPILWGRLQ